MKLPHWAQLVLALAVVVITWVMQQAAAGQLVLPAIAITVLTIVKTAIGMLTDSVPTGMAQKRAARLAAGSLSALVLLVLFAFAAVGCSGCGASLNPAVVGPSVDLGVCVIESVATDVAAGKPWSVCVTDAVANCGADAVSVSKIWDAHVAAEVKEGIVPKPIAGRDGGS